MEDPKQCYKNIPYSGGILVHCPRCGTKGEPVYRLGGKKWVNIILLILGIIPGILYLIRRTMNTICLCRKCYNEELGELNGDTELIKKLKNIQCKQNICFGFLIIILVLVILDIIFRFF